MVETRSRRGVTLTQSTGAAGKTASNARKNTKKESAAGTNTTRRSKSPAKKATAKKDSTRSTSIKRKAAKGASSDDSKSTRHVPPNAIEVSDRRYTTPNITTPTDLDGNHMPNGLRSGGLHGSFTQEYDRTPYASYLWFLWFCGIHGLNQKIFDEARAIWKTSEHWEERDRRSAFAVNLVCIKRAADKFNHKLPLSVYKDMLEIIRDQESLAYARYIFIERLDGENITTLDRIMMHDDETEQNSPVANGMFQVKPQPSPIRDCHVERKYMEGNDGDDDKETIDGEVVRD